MDAFRRIVHALRSSHRAAADLDLTGAQLFVLATLGAADEPMGIKDLAERTRTDQSTVSVVVGRLVDRGLVERARSTVDTRRVELSLTARGKMLQQKTPTTVAQQKLADALWRLSAADAATLARILKRIPGQLADWGGVGVDGSFLRARSRRRVRHVRWPTVTKRPPSCPSERIHPSWASHPSSGQLSAARSNNSPESVPSSASGYARTGSQPLQRIARRVSGKRSFLVKPANDIRARIAGHAEIRDSVRRLMARAASTAHPPLVERAFTRRAGQQLQHEIGSVRRSNG